MSDNYDKAIQDALNIGIRKAAKLHGISYSTLQKRVKKKKILATHTRPKTHRAPEKRVLVIPDLHCPFHHPDALAFLKAVYERHSCNEVVCLGDEADFHAFSRYTPDPNGFSPKKELELTIEALHPFYKAFPNVKVCTSNHTVRPVKKMFEAGLPDAFWPHYEIMLDAPDGWKWQDKWIIDDVLYFHGEGKSGQNAHIQFMKAYKQSLVHGHIHSYGAVSYEGKHFAMNAGCLIDEKAYAFKYAKHMPINVSIGAGVVIGGKAAIFRPMHRDDDNRWTGAL